MTNPIGKPADEMNPDGLNMRSLCQTLARVLVLLEETGYTEKQQDIVFEDDALPNPASDSAPARLGD